MKKEQDKNQRDMAVLTSQIQKIKKIVNADISIPHSDILVPIIAPPAKVVRDYPFKLSVGVSETGDALSSPEQKILNAIGLDGKYWRFRA